MIVQAIVTKYIGPSNVRGSRVKATASAGSVILTWNDALNSEDNHAAAARKLAEKYQWSGNWHCGGMPSNHGGYVFVCADECCMFHLTNGD
jgi:hypothetical protein